MRGEKCGIVIYRTHVLVLVLGVGDTSGLLFGFLRGFRCIPKLDALDGLVCCLLACLLAWLGLAWLIGVEVALGSQHIYLESCCPYMARCMYRPASPGMIPV